MKFFQTQRVDLVKFYKINHAISSYEKLEDSYKVWTDYGTLLFNRINKHMYNLNFSIAVNENQIKFKDGEIDYIQVNEIFPRKYK